jgi:hypothetical protein
VRVEPHRTSTKRCDGGLEYREVDMRVWRNALIGIGLLASLLAGVDRVSAAGKPRVFTYRGSGWTLSIWSLKSPYSAIRGTLSHAGQSYHVEGDWIPAGDAGGDLLRFFGHPFQSSSFVGLVGLATLYNTCSPDCADGRTYLLKGAMGWVLPGTQLHTVKLVIQT